MPLVFAQILARVAATAAVVAYAGLALLSGLDRLAAENAQIPSAAHWPYARNGAYNAALLASARHQWHTAEALMADAIHADPVSEHVIGGLGQVRLWAGDAAGADAAFRVSAQRGWRDPATHFYWMIQSIGAGDFATAALHADTLLRAPLDAKGRAQVINPLLEYNEGRDALAARLRLHPQWAMAFADDSNHPGAPPGSLDSPDELAAKADVIGRTGPGVWTCHETETIINRLIAADAFTQARAVHDATCANSARHGGSQPDPNVLNDPHFGRFLAEGSTSQLDWDMPITADLRIAAPQNGAGHGGVQIAVSRGVTMEIMAQRVIIPPGRYRLSWRMPDTAPDAMRRVLADMTCTPDLAKASVARPMPGQADHVQMDVPFTGACSAPFVTFWMQPSSTPVTIDDVSLVQTGPL